MRCTAGRGLHATGIGRVLNADSVAEVHEVIARGVTGDVALISLEFGPATGRLIHDLHRAGWPRVLVTTPTDDPDPVIHAFLAGASGVLRGPPATPAAATGRLPIQRLTDHEINVIRLVADGRTNRFIGQQLAALVGRSGATTPGGAGFRTCAAAAGRQRQGPDQLP